MPPKIQNLVECVLNVSQATNPAKVEGDTEGNDELCCVLYGERDMGPAATVNPNDPPCYVLICSQGTVNMVHLTRLEDADKVAHCDKARVGTDEFLEIPGL